MEINLTGEWEVEFQDYNNISLRSGLKLVQNGNYVMGIDRGNCNAYHVEGKITGSHFQGSYLGLNATNPEDNGEIELEIKNNGTVLDGFYVYYERDKGTKYRYTAKKIRKL
jgi:hypothetical protein